MLKIVENGVVVTLNGKSGSDSLFWISLIVGVLAIGVAIAMTFLSRELALIALAILVVACFLLNYYRQHKSGSGVDMSKGQVTARAGMLMYDNGVQHQRVLVLTDDTIQSNKANIVIYDKEQHKKCSITGFDSSKEVEVVVKVLQGHSLDKRLANIKMSSE